MHSISEYVKSGFSQIVWFDKLLMNRWVSSVAHVKVTVKVYDDGVDNNKKLFIII